MTLQQLEYIVSLDNHRNFVMAAERCFVTQPTLTMQVKKLEDEIGVILFDRTKKPLQPTLAGKRVISKARIILREVNQLKEFVSTEKESLTGSFSIGIIPTLAPYLLPLFLPGFTLHNPQTHLKILELRTEDIIRGLKNDTLDIGILVSPLEEKSIREIVLFYEPFLIYHSLTHSMARLENVEPAQLNVEDMLILDEGHCFRNQMLNICNSDGQRNALGFEYQNGSIESLKNLVNQGLGYTLVPELSVAGSQDNSQIKRFKAPEPVREVSMAVHTSFAKELLIEKLRAGMIKNLPGHLIKNDKVQKVRWR